MPENYTGTRIRYNSNDPEKEEIMGKPPHWMIRWGITIMFAILVGIVVGCYFIRYPQTVQAPVIITTLNPPADLVARYEGRIDSLFVTDGARVQAGQIIAFLQNSADYNNVCSVENIISSSYGERDFKNFVNKEFLYKKFILGELQTTFSEFTKQCMAYKHYLDVNYLGRKKSLLSEQINMSSRHYRQLEEQRVLYNREMEIAGKNERRDSMLYSKRIISSLDYEKSMQTGLQKKETGASLDAGLTSTKLGIMQSKQQLIELSMQRENEIAEYEESLNQYRQQLVSQISSWKEQYLLISPIRGKITFVNYWSSNQRIKVGETLASVVPEKSREVIGMLSIPSSGFGKVKIGQTVNIKLNGYPYMEFGVLKGRISRISAVPDGTNGYKAEVQFPKGLVTTYHKDLNMIQKMDGTAEIITKDMRLIEQFWQPVRELFKR